MSSSHASSLIRRRTPFPRQTAPYSPLLCLAAASCRPSHPRPPSPSSLALHCDRSRLLSLSLLSFWRESSCCFKSCACPRSASRPSHVRARASSFRLLRSRSQLCRLRSASRSSLFAPSACSSTRRPSRMAHTPPALGSCPSRPRTLPGPSLAPLPLFPPTPPAHSLLRRMKKIFSTKRGKNGGQAWDAASQVGQFGGFSGAHSLSLCSSFSLEMFVSSLEPCRAQVQARRRRSWPAPTRRTASSARRRPTAPPPLSRLTQHRQLRSAHLRRRFSTTARRAAS